MDDLEATLRKVVSLGGRILLAPIRNAGTLAFFADPEGHGIGLDTPL